MSQLPKEAKPSSDLLRQVNETTKMVNINQRNICENVNDIKITFNLLVTVILVHKSINLLILSPRATRLKIKFNVYFSILKM